MKCKKLKNYMIYSVGLENSMIGGTVEVNYIVFCKQCGVLRVY